MDIKQLYRQIIMDHHHNPQNKGLTGNDNYRKVHLHNPSCGDDITIEVFIEDELIKDIRQDGQGCSICCSSASVMSQTLIGLKVVDAKDIIQSFYNMLMSKPYDENILKGETLAYSGVRDFPARISCATLPWKALEQAINLQEEKK